MTTLHPAQERLFEEDFVTVEPPNGEPTYTGTIVAKRSANGVTTGYDVQIWDEDGPTAQVYTFTPREVSLHNHGRMTVIDNSSRKRFNNR